MTHGYPPTDYVKENTELYTELGSYYWTDTNDREFSVRYHHKDCSNPKFNNFANGSFIRCRRCDACLRFKMRYWRARAYKETETWPRTWFVTLTFKRLYDPMIVMGQMWMSGSQLQYWEIKKWLKRVRINYQRKNGKKLEIKYVCTTEYGSAKGRLHYHLLVHKHRS